MSKLSQAAKSGDRRATLTALRDNLATAIENTESGRDIAALSKRLMEVMAELDALPCDARAAANPVVQRRKRAARKESPGAG